MTKKALVLDLKKNTFYERDSCPLHKCAHEIIRIFAALMDKISCGTFFFILSIFSMSRVPLLAQDAPSINYIANIVDYRSFLLGSNIDARRDLKELMEKWESFDEDEMITQVASFVINDVVIYENRFRRIRKRALKEFPETKIIRRLTKGDVDVIINNVDLFLLMIYDVLDTSYPFKIKSNSWAIDEFGQYHIQPGDRVGEVGTGLGTFALLLSLTHPAIELYVNELNQNLVEFARYKMLRAKPFLRSQSFEFISGSERSAKMENLELDKIIIRQTYHHFEYPADMLKSIHQSLKSEGVLYIYDPILDLNGGKEACQETMYCKDIVDEVERYGFQLSKRIDLESRVVLSFKKY